MKRRPMLFSQVNDSCSRITDKIYTRTKALLIKGYAYEISNFVIAAIQKKDAMNAETNPENIHGSKSNFPKIISLSKKPDGRASIVFIRHFKIICPKTVKKIVPKI
jgi:hypothetical protein